MPKFSNLSSLQFFQIIRYGTFVLIGIGFAKLNLAQSNIAYYETFLLVSGMLSFFWVGGLINSMLSIYPHKQDTEKQILLFNTFLTLVLCSALSATLLYVFSNNLLAFLDRSESGNLIQLSIIYILFTCPTFISEYILYLNGKKNAIIYYALSVSVVTLLAALVPVALGYSLQYSIYLLILVAVVKFVIALLILRKYALFKADWSLILQNIHLATPLILTLFISGSSEYIDGLLVKSKFSDSQFTIYRYGAKELPILLLVANTFSTAMIPVIATNLNTGLADLKSKSARLMHIFFPISMVLMLFSSFIFQYVFSVSFLASAAIFNVYLLLAIPRLVFPQTILTSLQKSKYLLYSSIIEIVVNVSLSIYLASKIGIVGIALGTLIASCLDKLILISVNYYVVGIKPSSYIKLIPLLAYSFLILLVFGITLCYL